MADSKVTIKIDADAEGAKRAFAEVQSSADAAMESGARSAQKLSKSLDNVAESAKVSARQIKTVAAGMASMAAGVAAAAMRANGMDTEARYAQSASSSAVQGATMMAPLGPLAMILGAAGGGALGLLKQYFEDDAPLSIMMGDTLMYTPGDDTWRIYDVKKITEEELEKRIAYEVSVSKLETGE